VSIGVSAPPPQGKAAGERAIRPKYPAYGLELSQPSQPHRNRCRLLFIGMPFDVNAGPSQDANSFSVREKCPNDFDPKTILIDLQRTSKGQAGVGCSLHDI
jgi:hypothetical protein